MKTKKKYLMLVFEENSDKSLEFYSDNPYRGRLSDIVYGDNVKELMISSDGHSNEGLFYVLYSAVDGTMISYGIIDFAAITDEISSKENLSKANIITIVIARTGGLRKKMKNINHNGMKSSRCLTKQKKS